MYGQQFSNQGSSAPKWIFFGLFGIILMGFLLGMNIKDATWLNSGIAEAEAQRIQIESAHQQASYELQERKLAAQTEAEIRQIQREQEKLDAQHAHDLQILNQDIANRQRWADFKINAVTFMGVGAGILGALSIFTLVVAKAIVMARAVPSPAPVTPTQRTLPEMRIIPPMPERQPYEPLDQPVIDLKPLYDRRVEERLQEITQQNILSARMKAVIDPARMSKAEYNKRPLAGD